MGNPENANLTQKQERALTFAAQQHWSHEAAKAMREIQDFVYNWTYGADPEKCLLRIRQLSDKLGPYPDARP